jgi:hypothetical protein
VLTAGSCQGKASILLQHVDDDVALQSTHRYDNADRPANSLDFCAMDFLHELCLEFRDAAVDLSLEFCFGPVDLSLEFRLGPVDLSLEFPLGPVDLSLEFRLGAVDLCLKFSFGPVDFYSVQ